MDHERARQNQSIPSAPISKARGHNVDTSHHSRPRGQFFGDALSPADGGFCGCHEQFGRTGSLASHVRKMTLEVVQWFFEPVPGQRR